MLLYQLQMIGTAVFAATGVLAVNRRGLDVFGAGVLGIVTALGGGTLRDVVLGVPVFWLQDLNYLWMAIAASVIVFFADPRVRSTYTLLLYLDGLGAALFAVQATEKVLWLQHAGTVAVAMGILTSIGGGLVRDVLAGRPTLLMSRDIYATPVLIGCTGLVLAKPFTTHDTALVVAAVGVIFAIRASAIHWHISMPAWLTRDQDPRP
jgi:uncharacterized membrane protein YeiH